MLLKHEVDSKIDWTPKQCPELRSHDEVRDKIVSPDFKKILLVQTRDKSYAYIQNGQNWFDASSDIGFGAPFLGGAIFLTDCLKKITDQDTSFITTPRELPSGNDNIAVRMTISV